MDKRITLKDLFPIIIAAAKVSAEQCNCEPEDVLLSVIHVLKQREKRKNNINNVVGIHINTNIYNSFWDI